MLMFISPIRLRSFVCVIVIKGPHKDIAGLLQTLFYCIVLKRYSLKMLTGMQHV